MYVAMLVSTNASGGSVAYGKALRTNGSSSVPVLSHNGFGQDIAASTLLKVPADVVITTAGTASTGPAQALNVGGLELDWGRWDNIQIEVKANLTTTSAVPANDIEWAVFRPANMASLNGTYRYGTDSRIPLRGTDDTGTALRGGLIEFDVNLAGGPDAISNGLLQVFDSRNSTWRVTFNGDIQGPYARMTDISGTFGGSGFVTGAIGGVFVTTPAGGIANTPDFITGFSLQSGSNFVQGFGLMNNETCISCSVSLP